MFTMPYADIEARDHVEGRPQAPVTASDDTMAMTTFGPVLWSGKDWEKTDTYIGTAFVPNQFIAGDAGYGEGGKPVDLKAEVVSGRMSVNEARSHLGLGPAPRYHAVNDNDPLAGKAAVVELNALADLPGFVYLGSPYSLYRTGHNAAAYEVAVAAVRLMQRGLRVYSPIAHGHFVSKHGDLPQTWGFWKEQCQPMIDAASSLVVLMMHGWQDSVGLSYEIEAFAAAGKPIVYVEPEALVVPREEDAVDGADD